MKSTGTRACVCVQTLCSCTCRSFDILINNSVDLGFEISFKLHYYKCILRNDSCT